MNFRSPKIGLKSLAVALFVSMITLMAAVPGLLMPPLPQPLPPDGNCFHDNIFYGAVPANSETSRVLVFVHGLSGLAEDWWLDNTTAGLNDMYIQAYTAGYRTAFVNLNVKLGQPNDCSVTRRPAHGMMDNALILNEQIETILQHYNVSQVDMIAHSKGGIDAQAAIVWRGDWQRVRNLFTLATPHQGSLLADLLWSPEGFWVSVLLGQRDDATRSLTTAAMQAFRLTTDASSVDEAVHYYSGAGNFWQTPGSLFEVTGEWLQNHPDGGNNDGVVTVDSTYLPTATTLFLEPWNHHETYLGRNAFPYIQQILLEQEARQFTIYLPVITAQGNDLSFAASQVGPDHSLDRPGTSAPVTLPSNYILRGGRLNESVLEVIPVEPQAGAIRVNLLATDAQVTAKLQGPDGSTYPLAFRPTAASDFIANAFSATQEVSGPGPGRWSVQIDGSVDAGYLLLATFDSPLHLNLADLPPSLVLAGESVRFVVRSGQPDDIDHIDQLTLRLVPSISAPDETSLEKVEESRFTDADASLSYTFSEEAIYGLSLTVSGRTPEGYPFERTFIQSLAVVSPETLADDAALIKLLGK